MSTIVASVTRVQPKSESYDITRQGVSAFIAAMLQGDSSAEPINILAVDAMIADIDARTSRQMDAIIHAPEFQELESLLRSLKLLVERADTGPGGKHCCACLYRYPARRSLLPAVPDAGTDD